MEVHYSIINRLINPGEVILVTTKYKEKSNIITVAWQTPVSYSLVAISIGKKRYTHKILSETNEFVINIPTKDIFSEVIKCGNISGEVCDKVAMTKLTEMNSKKVLPKRIKECVGWLECKVINKFDCKTHTLFIGEVLLAEVKDGLFTTQWKEGIKLIHHLGGNIFYFSPDSFYEGKG